MSPILQVALDFVDLPRALKLAAETKEGGADWLEAGTPLIKSVGLDCIRELRKNFPDMTIVADMKTMDVGRIEVEMAAKSGANVIGVLGMASESTIRECVEAAGNYGARIMADMIEASSPVDMAQRLQDMGVDYLCLHTSIDDQMKGCISFDTLSEVVKIASIPVAIAGGINSENILAAVQSGAGIIIVGGAITKSEDAVKSTRQILSAIREKVSIKTKFFRRCDQENIREILSQVSCANISDAMHRALPLAGISSVRPGLKMVGRAVTVRTSPGDWAKPVEAIDGAREGDVIVIDAGGSGPAVWGELATHSSIQKKLNGVVINGAIRDVEYVRELGFPAFAGMITPAAGEPKGFGEIGIPIMIGGVRIYPGDWIVADDDGVMVIPQKRAVEISNRSMDVLEKENRIRKEINQGQTLGDVAEILRWEKK